MLPRILRGIVLRYTGLDGDTIFSPASCCTITTPDKTIIPFPWSCQGLLLVSPDKGIGTNIRPMLQNDIKDALRKARYMNKKPMGKKQMAEVFKGVTTLKKLIEKPEVRFNPKIPDSIGDILKGLK